MWLSCAIVIPVAFLPAGDANVAELFEVCLPPGGLRGFVDIDCETDVMLVIGIDSVRHRPSHVLSGQSGQVSQEAGDGSRIRLFRSVAY